MIFPKWIRASLKLCVLMVLLVWIFGGWLWWDMRRVRAFCDEVKPGTLVASLPEIASRHGVDSKWFKSPGVYDEKAGDWFLPIPAPSTMGDMICAIHHDQTLVKSAATSGP